MALCPRNHAQAAACILMNAAISESSRHVDGLFIKILVVVLPFFARDPLSQLDFF